MIRKASTASRALWSAKPSQAKLVRDGCSAAARRDLERLVLIGDLPRDLHRPLQQRLALERAGEWCPSGKVCADTKWLTANVLGPLTNDQNDL